MSYTENNYLSVNSEQIASSGITSDKYNKLVLALAAVMGVIGSAAVGVGSGIDVDSIYQMTSAAFPQLTAWIISYMMYQNSNSLNFSNLQSYEMPTLPEKSLERDNI